MNTFELRSLQFCSFHMLHKTNILTDFYLDHKIIGLGDVKSIVLFLDNLKTTLSREVSTQVCLELFQLQFVIFKYFS